MLLSPQADLFRNLPPVECASRLSLSVAGSQLAPGDLVTWGWQGAGHSLTPSHHPPRASSLKAIGFRQHRASSPSCKEPCPLRGELCTKPVTMPIGLHPGFLLQGLPFPSLSALSYMFVLHNAVCESRRGQGLPPRSSTLPHIHASCRMHAFLKAKC